jgi:hypothetical protein
MHRWGLSSLHTDSRSAAWSLKLLAASPLWTEPKRRRVSSPVRRPSCYRACGCSARRAGRALCTTINGMRHPFHTWIPDSLATATAVRAGLWLAPVLGWRPLSLVADSRCRPMLLEAHHQGETGDARKHSGSKLKRSLERPGTARQMALRA